MSSKKQITIDAVMGGQSAYNTTVKRQRKVKPPVALLRPSTVKKNLLEKIKDYKRRNEETPLLAPTQMAQSDQLQMSNKDLANQFKVSSSYLEQLINKKKEARKYTTPRTMHKQARVIPPPMQVPVTMQPQSQVMQVPVTMQPQAQVMQVPVTMQPQAQVMHGPAMHAAIHDTAQYTEISLDLPPELQINPLNTLCLPLQPMNTESSMVNAIAEPTYIDMVPAPAPAPSPAPTIIKNDVPYGCLRDGNKPTYRTYHRNLHPPKLEHTAHSHTLKKPFAMSNSNPALNAIMHATTDPEESAMIQERQRKLRELQEKASAKANIPNVMPPTQDLMNDDAIAPKAPTKFKHKIKQTITKKYKLGRTPGANVVGVLIKNNETRRQVQQEHGVLKCEPIIEIRKYLHDHGLLKMGSDAPPDVLRNMYETARLTGEVNNVNKHVLLHNFIATADKHS